MLFLSRCLISGLLVCILPFCWCSGEVVLRVCVACLKYLIHDNFNSYCYCSVSRGWV